MLESIRIADIVVRPRRREAGDIVDLAESIWLIGLLNPITVCIQRQDIGNLPSHDAPVLVAGLRRLEACKALGWEEISVNVVELSDLDLELAEIDENLVRLELTALQRAEQLARSKWIYEMMYPGAPKGRGRPTKQGEHFSLLIDKQNPAFTESYARDMRVTQRTVQQDVRIAEGIPLKLRDALRDTDMEDSREDLRALAANKKDPVLQKRAVEKYKAGKVVNLRKALEPKAVKNSEERRFKALCRAWYAAGPVARAWFLDWVAKEERKSKAS